MRILFFLFFIASPTLLFSQEKTNTNFDINSKYNSSDSIKKKKPPVATIDMYRIITLDRDTTYVDTSLTIQKEYSHNNLRKDLFGLLSFANEGQTYNTLQYSLTDFSPFLNLDLKPNILIFWKQTRYDIILWQLQLPELYFKSTMQKGQSTDAFINFKYFRKPQFFYRLQRVAFSGKYINQLSSTGNFRFTVSYNTKNKRYYANAHYTYQDILNEENGGITTISDFESEDPNYNKDKDLKCISVMLNHF